MSTLNQANPNRQAVSPFFVAAIALTITLTVVAAVVAFL